MVLKCEPQQERLLLSFRLSSKPAPEDKKECTPKKKQEVKYQIGEVLNSMTAPFFAFFYLFSKQFGIALNNFASRKAVGGQELALNVHFLLCGWPPGPKPGSLLSEVTIRSPRTVLLEVPISAPVPRWSPLSSGCCCFCSLEKDNFREMF